MTDLYDYHNGPNLGLEPTTPRQVRGEYMTDIKLPERPEPDGFITDGPFDKPVVINVYRDSTLEAYAREAVRMNASQAENVEPSDEEIDSIAASMPDGAGGMLKQWGYLQFARALLARYAAQPAASFTQVGTWEPDDPRWFIWNPGIVRDSFPAGTPIYVGQPTASADRVALADELAGVVADVEQGKGFDRVCLDTIKRVRNELLKQPAASVEPSEVDMDEYQAMLAVMEQIDPATFPGLTAAQRCALSRFAKPLSALPQRSAGE